MADSTESIDFNCKGTQLTRGLCSARVHPDLAVPVTTEIQREDTSKFTAADCPESCLTCTLALRDCLPRRHCVVECRLLESSTRPNRNGSSREL